MPSKNADTYSSKNEDTSSGLTVGDIIRRVLPQGTNGFDPDSRAACIPRWHKCPLKEADLFAVAGYLLEISGAYQYFVAPFESSNKNTEFYYQRPDGKPQNDSQEVSAASLEKWEGLGLQWSNLDDKAERQVQKLWAQLWRFKKQALHGQPRHRQKWWDIAHALLVIADAAGKDIGYVNADSDVDAESGTRKHSLFAIISALVAESQTVRRPIKDKKRKPDRRHLSVDEPSDGLTWQVDLDVVRVLPKGRTAALGCSMRTLSHHLALVPGRGGYGTVYWHHPGSSRNPPAPVSRQPAAATENAPDPDDLCLLLVPFPFFMNGQAFSSDAHNSSDAHDSPDKPKWGRFKINQSWLKKDAAGKPDNPAGDFCLFIKKLIDKARADGSEVNALILPEYALDWETYDKVACHIRDHQPEIEFMVSGVSSDCILKKGNLVVSTLFVTRSKQDGTEERIALTHSRPKHHRWRVDKKQIENYGIGAHLADDTEWWEYINIGNRVMHLDVLRNNSTFTALICEDLARSDPAHPWLRALGPHLIFALLMDGPQLTKRWPAQYATGLADDPCSSVLTLTSHGLIGLSNAKKADDKKSHSIGLWRQDNDTNLSVQCNPTAKQFATLLHLSANEIQEFTLTGRCSTESVAWRLNDNPDKGNSEIAEDTGKLKRKKQIGIPVALSDDEIKAGQWEWICYPAP